MALRRVVVPRFRRGVGRQQKILVTDSLTKRERSKVMGAIRSTGNRATELRLASILRSNGVTGWRRHQLLPGKPDFVFRRERLAVFVDGCFWHGCPWHCRMPKSRQNYWVSKIARNKSRDKAIRVLLQEAGWRIHRIWEHALNRPSSVVVTLTLALQSDTRQTTRAH